MSGFNWPGLMRVAISAGIRPSDFWALTPAEFEFLLGKTSAGQPLTRRRLDELASAYPDTSKEEANGPD